MKPAHTHWWSGFLLSRVLFRVLGATVAPRRLRHPMSLCNNEAHGVEYFERVVLVAGRRAMVDLADLGWAVEGPPVGVWLTSNGTFDNVMWQRLTVRPDGTGQLDSWSAMHGAEEHRIRWEHIDFGVLQIELRFDDDEPDQPPDWEMVRYFAATAQRDAGGPVRVLKNIIGTEFWHLVGPIEYQGPLD